MSFFSVTPKPSCMAGLFLLVVSSAAAQAPDSTATAAPTRAGGSGTLIKLGTGLTRGLVISGYGGVSVPLVLSGEHHITPAVSLYVNAFSGINLGRRYFYYDGSRRSVLSDLGFDAGIRYYYNQEKRRQKGRATGPFVGNYLALQTTSVFNPGSFYRSYNRSYDQSTLAITWGMQRRLGKYGWFDAYAGMGIHRRPSYNYYYSSQPSRPDYFLAPEIGIKVSLGSSLK